MKKIIAFVLTLTLLLCATVNNVSALSGETVIAVDISPYVDNEFNLRVKITADSKIYGGELILNYDADKAVFLSGQDCNLLEKGTIKFAGASSAEKIEFSASFKALARGKADFYAHSIKIADGDDEVDVPNVDFTVLIAKYAKGDINGDGTVNAADLTRLKKVLAGTVTDGYSGEADLNLNGKVDAADLTRLKKFLAGTITAFD